MCSFFLLERKEPNVGHGVMHTSVLMLRLCHERLWRSTDSSGAGGAKLIVEMGQFCLAQFGVDCSLLVSVEGGGV